MDTELINIIITAAVTLVSGGGVAAFLFRRQNRRLKDAEAVAAELSAASQFSATVKEMSDTIAMLNHTIDSKTARIREVEDRLVTTERENTRLAEENGELKKELAEKRCHLLDCAHREPPTDRSRKAAAAEKAAADSVKATAAKPSKTKSKSKKVDKDEND